MHNRPSYVTNAELNVERHLIDKMKIENNFSSPRKFSSFTDKDLEEFAGVMLPGGESGIQNSSLSTSHASSLWIGSERAG